MLAHTRTFTLLKEIFNRGNKVQRKLISENQTEGGWPREVDSLPFIEFILLITFNHQYPILELKELENVGRLEMVRRKSVVWM